MKNKKCIISCGKCYSKYCYLIFGVISIYFLMYSLSFLFDAFSKKNKLDINNTLNVMSFLFFLNLGESFIIILHLIFKKNISNNKTRLIKKNKDHSMKYIFHNYSPKISFKEQIILIVVILLKLFLDIVYIFYHLYIEKITDIYITTFAPLQFELIFLFFLTKLFSNIHFYRHQYLSIIIITAIELLKFIIKYDNKSVIIFFRNLIVHIAYSFLKSLITIYIKELMDHKFLSPYKACYIFGFINWVIITFVYILLSYIPCDKLLCKVKYNNKKYFANIWTIFNISGLFMFFIFILKAIISALNYVVIHDFSVCHSILIIQFMQITEKGTFDNSNNINHDTTTIFILKFLFLCLNIFFILIFLEIIELNICNMNYNTQKNIENRSIDDLNYYSLGYDENSDEDENDENILENNNNGISVNTIN